MLNMTYVISNFFKNFSLSMLLLAMLAAAVELALVKSPRLKQIIFRWVCFFGLGVTGIFAFIMHGFYPQLAANNIGWHSNPFQYEVAIANLSFGLLGLLAVWAPFQFRLATVLGACIWLWGAAIGHIHQIILHHNMSMGNAGSWLWMDILIPLILLLTLCKGKS
jgi:hypothetical protein